MNEPILSIKVENAIHTDFLELQQAVGDGEVQEMTSADAGRADRAFGEPGSASIILLTLGKVAAGAFAGWVAKQKGRGRTTLRITITTPDGTVTQIDLADPQFSTQNGAAALASQLAKAGITLTSGQEDH
jgi:hypothetical protein